MRFYHYILIGLVLLIPHRASAQSVALSPPALSSVPKGATAANPYWQHLVISLTRNPSAGNSITINLPAGVSIADTDGDGEYADEVALDDSSSTGTGYNSTTGTGQSQIILQSGTGGVSGKVHVQYPIVTPASSTTSSTAYGQISFSNSSELAIPAGSLVLSLVEARSLNLATFSRLFLESAVDTTTNAQGDAYPDTAAAAFALALPDLVSDLRGNLLSDALTAAGVPFADGSDSNDVQYAFWFSQRDTLAKVDTSVAALALERTTLQAAQIAEKSLGTLAFDVSSLQDTTYYLYMTSNLTGNFPLMRSRGILVRHKPVVLSVGDFKSGDADFLDSGLLLDFDKGQASLVDSAKSSVAIDFAVVDYDDSASVRLFYAVSDTLDTTYRLRYDSAAFRLRSARPGTAFERRPAVYAEQRETGLIAMGAALNGGQAGVGGSQDLGYFVFERLQTKGNQGQIEIRDAQWVDAGHRVRVPRGQAALPTVFSLAPNFPNPFNPETSLRLHLPERGEVELAVFDAMGQRVRTLLIGELAAGVHVAVWDGRDQSGHGVASGTYFARLRAGSKMQVRKMTLLR